MRNVIVTGGSRGLGLAIVSALSDAGYGVIAIARADSPGLRSLMTARKDQNVGPVHFRAYDLTNTQGLAEFVAGLRREIGPFYGLVNNAGIGTAGVLALMREDDIEKVVRLNSIAPMLLSKYVLRSMMVEHIGRIVNISSIVASSGYSGLSVYSATKASMIGFTRSLAREVGQLGITVNAVAPGFIGTEMTREIDDGQREKIVRRAALRRLAEAEDIAAAVEFLLSDKAKNITGATITVDAGSTA